MRTILYTKHNIVPKTVNQEKYVKSMYSVKKPIVFAIGPAGSGKTLLGCKTGIQHLEKQKISKVILTRPATGGDENLGYLPGTLDEKMKPWVQPLIDSFMLRNSDIEHMKYHNKLEIVPFAFMRGRTFNNSWIIADEMQNATSMQLKMLLTRLGPNSKIVVTGDLNQCDIDDSGLETFLNEAKSKKLKYIDIVELENNDIIRHDAITEVLDIYDCLRK